MKIIKIMLLLVVCAATQSCRTTKSTTSEFKHTDSQSRIQEETLCASSWAEWLSRVSIDSIDITCVYSTDSSLCALVSDGGLSEPGTTHGVAPRFASTPSTRCAPPEVSPPILSRKAVRMTAYGLSLDTKAKAQSKASLSFYDSMAVATQSEGKAKSTEAKPKGSASLNIAMLAILMAVAAIFFIRHRRIS